MLDSQSLKRSPARTGKLIRTGVTDKVCDRVNQLLGYGADSLLPSDRHTLGYLTPEYCLNSKA